MKINWKLLIFYVLISLGTGALAGYVTPGSRELYQNLIKPPLSPPGFIFPIVWTILYILMGISAYMIASSDAEGKDDALKIFAIQLVFNFMWSIAFFHYQNYLTAFIILLVLWVMIYIMMKEFKAINETAAKLLVPYFIWVTFAGYLNFAIFLLNH